MVYSRISRLSPCFHGSLSLSPDTVKKNKITTATRSEIASTIRGFCQEIHSPLIHIKDLRKHDVTLYFLIDKECKLVHDLPAVYFVQPTQPNVDLIAAAVSRSLYDSFQLNFSSSISVFHVIVGML